MNKINWGFLSSKEGFSLRGYIPRNKEGKILGRSGVTIATGIDLGQQSPWQIQQLKISKELKEKLIPYANKIKTEAAEFLLKNPLMISTHEAITLDNAMKEREIKTFALRFQAITGKRFEDLPAQAQTAIASIVWNLGINLHLEYPTLWGYIKNLDWKGLSKFLDEFPSKQPELENRRRAEAQLLKQLENKIV